jgi:octaprenyl-diphosphate synthase
MDTAYTATTTTIPQIPFAPPPAAAMDIGSIYALIRGKLNAVERELLVHAQSGGPSMERMGPYLVKGGGKRLRPALLLLASQAIGADEDDRDTQSAVAIEMLHMATLVHDDVIDGARTRHGCASVNLRWGNTLSVLFGDLLFTESISILLGGGDLDLMKMLTDATRSLVLGEILEIEHAGSLSITREMALKIISCKTADLFAAACIAPSYFRRPRTEAFAAPLRAFGHGIGMAFQLVDDLLDYTATELHIGKPVLSDLCEGKLTMPLVLTLPRTTAVERERIATVLRERAFQTVAEGDILEIVEGCGGIAETRAMAAQFTDEARSALGKLPESAAKTALQCATEYLYARTR